MEVVRIDKWLWAARFYKTRSAATDAVLGGRVHLNDARVKPSKEVKAGDVVEVKVGQLQWTVVVRSISAKRGPASVAQCVLSGGSYAVASQVAGRVCVFQGRVLHNRPVLGSATKMRKTRPPFR